MNASAILKELKQAEGSVLRGVTADSYYPVGGDLNPQNDEKRCNTPSKCGFLKNKMKKLAKKFADSKKSRTFAPQLRNKPHEHKENIAEWSSW